MERVTREVAAADYFSCYLNSPKPYNRNKMCGVCCYLHQFLPSATSVYVSPSKYVCDIDIRVDKNV